MKCSWISCPFKSYDDVECCKRPRSVRECAKVHSLKKADPVINNRKGGSHESREGGVIPSDDILQILFQKKMKLYGT